jgi:flagellar biosynthesis/type III secretory pathway protein FliH
MGRVVKAFGHVAKRVVLEARDEAAAVREEARRNGHAEGFERGRAEGLAAAAALLAAARVDATRALDGAAPAAIVLARKMAEKIVGRAVELSPPVMAEIVGAALDACRPGGFAVKLRLHPEDLDAVAARLGTLAARAPAAGALELVADEAVGRHGCVIETARGRVDARLATQLAALERALLGQTGE